jgi:hypothetical protein
MSAISAEKPDLSGFLADQGYAPELKERIFTKLPDWVSRIMEASVSVHRIPETENRQEFPVEQQNQPDNFNTGVAA